MVHLPGSNALRLTECRLLTNLFDLLDTGSIKPLAPMQSFAYDKVPEALHTLRDGNILGKLVISREVNNGVKVPVSIRSF